MFFQIYNNLARRRAVLSVSRVWTIEVGGVSRGPGVPTSPFVSHVFYSKQPKTGGENDMTVWRVPSFWQSVTPSPFRKIL